MRFTWGIIGWVAVHSRVYWNDYSILKRASAAVSCRKNSNTPHRPSSAVNAYSLLRREGAAGASVPVGRRATPFGSHLRAEYRAAGPCSRNIQGGPLAAVGALHSENDMAKGVQTQLGEGVSGVAGIFFGGGTVRPFEGYHAPPQRVRGLRPPGR